MIICFSVSNCSIDGSKHLERTLTAIVAFGLPSLSCSCYLTFLLLFVFERMILVNKNATAIRFYSMPFQSSIWIAKGIKIASISVFVVSRVRKCGRLVKVGMNVLCGGLAPLSVVTGAFLFVFLNNASCLPA